jgi:hypothetical protein
MLNGRTGCWRPGEIQMRLLNGPPAGHAQSVAAALALSGQAAPASGLAGAGSKRTAPRAPAPRQTQRLRQDTGEWTQAQQSRQVRTFMPDAEDDGYDAGGNCCYEADDAEPPPPGPADAADGTEDALATQDFVQREQHSQAAASAPWSRQVITYTPAAVCVFAKRQAGIRARSSTSGVVRSTVPTTLLRRKDGFKVIDEQFLELRNSDRLGAGDPFVDGSRMWVQRKQSIGVGRCRLKG